jgi:hypothetical protein
MLSNQIEAAGPVAQLLEAAVADFAQAVEEHGDLLHLIFKKPLFESTCENIVLLYRFERFTIFQATGFAGGF